MYKNIRRIHAQHISEGFSLEHYKQLGGITQMIVDAVTQYNKTLPLLGNFENKNVDERLIKEAEEESAKVFLDGILDIMQRWNTENNFCR